MEGSTVRALHTPPGPTAPSGPGVGTLAPLPETVLLEATVPASGRRPWAHVIDGVLALVAGCLGALLVLLLGVSGVAAAILGTVVALVVVGAMLASLTRVGRTPGLRCLGLRVVDRSTALPPRPGRRSPGGVLAADLRRGRDPLRLQPAGATSSATTSETGRWHDLGEARRSVVRLTVDDGTTFTLSEPTLVGRDPVPPAGSSWEVHAIPDLTRTIARNHALLEPDADGVQVTDLGSTKGTTVITSDGRRRPVAHGDRVAAPSGGRIAVGARLVLVTTEEGQR